MSSNPFREAKNESDLDDATSNGNGLMGTNGIMHKGKSEGLAVHATAVQGEDLRRNGDAEKLGGISEDCEQHYQHLGSIGRIGAEAHVTNGVYSQHASNGLAVQPVLQQILSANTSTGSDARAHESNVDSLSEEVEGFQIEQRPDAVIQRGHAHVPSISHVRKESLTHSRPIYVRALSSQITEVQATQFTPGEAHAEAIRRLGKVDRSSKTLKRRGSNESLSSLISYSIRRPSIPARPESGYSLDALATVLEDAAQEGNLALVEAVMALGANPNFRSVNRLKNRRHDALNKATAAGHVDVIDYLLRQGATFTLSDILRKETFTPIDLKLLDVAYSGQCEVARYLISKHNANPFIEQWPREYFDANRTIYRRVDPMKVYQRSVLDAIAKVGDASQDMSLLSEIMSLPPFDPSRICTRIYSDLPYLGSNSRMQQSTSDYSALAAFAQAGWADAVQSMLAHQPSPAAYEHPETVTTEEGQIPSTHIHRSIFPANALTKHTYLAHPAAAHSILALLINHGFDIATPQQTPHDSAPRSPLGRAIAANAAPAVDLLLQARPALVHVPVSFRLRSATGTREAEYAATPLAAALVQECLESARVLLRHGARPQDPAFGHESVLVWAKGWGGKVAKALLGEMVEELRGEVVDGVLEQGGGVRLSEDMVRRSEGGGDEAGGGEVGGW
tara:strand:+ start:13163 stop:15193 length:2031 start_codon:yes stop_codon:yes gene_type:complete